MSFIYHIAQRSDWEQAERDGEYTTSTRGVTLAEQGFIHCSEPEQVAGVANFVYKNLPDLLLLVIDPDRVRSSIQYDYVPDETAPYPHIYGPLNPDAVVDVRTFEPGPDGTFSFAAPDGS